MKRILYASGSGVYGDTGLLEVAEDHTPLSPISTYGASKLGCERCWAPIVTCSGSRAGRSVLPMWWARGKRTAWPTISFAV